MAHSNPQDQLPYSGYRILVADDNAINCQIAKRLLEKLGCTVDLANSGTQVLAMHARHPYDLILLDCQMPDLNGYLACARLREMEGQHRTPVIGWTANAQQDEMDRCSTAGMDDCLSKHLRLDGLEQMLALWLRPSSVYSPALHPSDLSGLESMCKISGSGFAELVALFEEDMPQRIEELSQALTKADLRSAARIAHMMSGCCASIGALHLSDLCQAVEQRAAGYQNEDSLPDQLENIRIGYQQVLHTLHALRDHLPR